MVMTESQNQRGQLAFTIVQIQKQPFDHVPLNTVMR